MKEVEVIPGVIVEIPEEGTGERMKIRNETGGEIFVDIGDYPYSVIVKVPECDPVVVHFAVRPQTLYTDPRLNGAFDDEDILEAFGPPIEC